MITLDLGLVVTNASNGCRPQTLSIVASATVSGPSGGATAVVTPGIFVIAPRNSAPGTVTVTLPAGQAVGKYTVTVTLNPMAGTPMFPTRVCSGDVAVTSVFEVRELNGNVCTVPGFETQKKYRLVNKTGSARTINWTVRSRQNSSSAGVDDHFPIEICGTPLGAGDPTSTTIPSRSGTVTIPAGVDSFVDVCIDTRAYGGCQAGSNCCISIEALDVATGERACANTDVTAVAPDWQGCPVLGRGACDGGLGNVTWTCELDPLTDEPSNEGHLGVQHVNGRLYVSSRGPGGVPPHKVYVIDENCCLVDSYDQPPATSASAWGFRDGATDGSRLAFGDESGIHLIDPATGALAGAFATQNSPAGDPVGSANLPSNPITGPALTTLGIYRALAYDPAGNGGEGSFWTASFGSALVEIDLAGNILTSWPNGGWSAYGLALDPDCPGSLWVNSAPTTGPIAEIDTTTGLLTGASFGRRTPGSSQGGLCLVPGGWANSGNAADLIGLDQADPDGLTSYRLNLYSTVFGKEECKLVTRVTSPLTGTTALDPSDKGAYNGDDVEWFFQAPPALTQCR